MVYITEMPVIFNAETILVQGKRDLFNLPIMDL